MKYVDIVSDVINLVPVHWISEIVSLMDLSLLKIPFLFIIQAGLPLTETNPHGAWCEQNTYKMFAEVARYTPCHFISFFLMLNLS